VIEAGLEDALSQLNTHGSTNLACDGWTVTADGIYYPSTVKRTVGDNYYVITITNFNQGSSNNFPIIESRGYVNMPVLVSSANQPFLGVLGSPSVTTSGSLIRGVRCTTKPEYVFSKGMVAKGQIDLKGNNIKTDSFDSTDPTYSTNGLYTQSKAKANGDVATDSGLTNSLNVGNANVWGHVSTGPGGSVDIGPQGCVGDTNFQAQASNNGKIEPGYFTDDMNVDFPDVKVPFSGGFTPSNGQVGGTNYDYVLSGGNYRNSSSFSMDSTKKMIVTGNSSWYVGGNFSLSGNATIIIAPGASLKLYVNGSTSIGGNGIANQSGNAMNFMYYGTTNNTSISLSGNASFIGTIYAPSAALTLNGGGLSTLYDFTGASITSTVQFDGHVNFHYDEALGKLGPFRGFIVTSWNELTPTQVSTLPGGLSLSL
jgi:hypothetical protein